MLNITITKENVIRNVIRESSVAAARISGIPRPAADGQGAIADYGNFDRVRATDSDRETLTAYFERATGNISRVCPDRYERLMIVVGTNDVTFQISEEEFTKPELTSSMEADLRDYYMNYVLSHWLSLTGYEGADKYAEQSAQAMRAFVRKLYYRKGLDTFRH